MQLDNRVRTALAQRDESIRVLQEQLEECNVRRRFAEEALTKHRQDALQQQQLTPT